MGQRSQNWSTDRDRSASAPQVHRCSSEREAFSGAHVDREETRCDSPFCEITKTRRTLHSRRWDMSAGSLAENALFLTATRTHPDK